MTNNAITIAWAAGIIEGEGTFNIRTNGQGRIAVTMTDLDILERLQAAFGGKIYVITKRKEHWKDAWIWSLTKKNEVVEAIDKIMPHLGQRRRAKAQELLSSYENYSLQKKDKSENIADMRKTVMSYKGSGLTHLAIAELLGVHRTTVSHTLRGKYKV